MDDLRVFENKEFGLIRTAETDGEPVFCLADVCRVLELTTPSKVKERLNPKGVNSIHTLTSGGMQSLIFIDESNLYKVIFQSRKPEAERFADWVTSEVLPSIRRTGGYISGQESMSDSELMAKALLVAQRQIEERNALIRQQQEKIRADKPKIIFADAVSASRGSILIGELAKLICQNGVQIGQNRLFQWLRDNGYLIKRGESRNMPMQRYLEHGLFEIQENSVHDHDGIFRVTRTTKVTCKGQAYFINKFLNKSEP